MWTVVYIASSRTMAEDLQLVLTKEGVMVRLRALGSSQEEGGTVEILVPESEAEEATEILQQVLY